MNTNPSQTDKIIDRLAAAQGTWVSMPELYQVSGAFAVHSRISEARTKRGLCIDHKNVRQPDGTIHSFYRLVEPYAIYLRRERATGSSLNFSGITD